MGPTAGADSTDSWPAFLDGWSNCAGAVITSKQTPDAATHPPRVELHLAAGTDAFEVWRSAISHLYDVTLPGDDSKADFRGDVTGFHLGDSLIFNNTSVAQDLVRTAAHARHSGVDLVMLQYQKWGRHDGDYQGRPVSLRPGDIGFVDFSHAASSTDTDFSRVTLLMPRERLPKAFRDRDLHGVVYDGKDKATGLLARYLIALFQSADQLTLPEVSAAVNIAFVLAEGVEGTTYDVSFEGESAAHRTTRQMVLSYIDQHLAQPDLTPDKITAGLRFSRSALYSLFAAEGGIRSVIFTRRLDRSFDVIVNSPVREASIGAIAFANGFKSEAHFSRAFRRRYGVSPRAIRHLAAARVAQSVGRDHDPSAPAMLVDWVRRLGGGSPDAT